MSRQQRLTDDGTATPYRSIVKDAYSTRDDGDSGDTRLEIASWLVMEHVDEEAVKDEKGNLQYDRMLEHGLDAAGAEEIARRTSLKSYADDRGGRAESTIRGYRNRPDLLAPKDQGGLPSSHPVKRVLRRLARSRGLGHFRDDQATEKEPDEDAEPIEMEKLFAAYRFARSIASQNGFGFAPQSGDPVAVEDNERIDYDEIRPPDRPMGDTKAAVLLTKPSGETYEYRVDLDTQELDPVENGNLPPGGW